MKQGWRFLVRLWDVTDRREIGLIAAGVAFFGFLALFPALAAVIALWGAVSDPQIIRSQLDPLAELLPPEAFALVAGQIDALLAVSGRALGLTTLLSTAFALWSARAGVAALIRGLNALHGLPNRSGAWHQTRALVLTFALIALAMAAMILAVVAPLLIAILPLGNREVQILGWANDGLALLLVVSAMAMAYRLGPTHPPHHRPNLLTRGLLVGVGLWLLAAKGFVLYLANFPAYNQIYGSIGAVAALQMWLYLSAYAVLLGAAVDAEYRPAAKPPPQPSA